MSVGLVTRHRGTVTHLAVWAYDRHSEAAYDTGRFVPLCGQERDHNGRWHLVAWPGGHGDGTPRLPLCTRCRFALTDLTELASRREPPPGPRPRSGQAGTAIPHAVCP